MMTRRYHIQILLIILGLTRTRHSVTSTSTIYNKHSRRRYIRRQLGEPKEEIEDGHYNNQMNDEQTRHSTLEDIKPIITTLGRRDLNYIEASDSSRDYVSHFKTSEQKGITITADIPQSHNKDSTDFVDKKTSNTLPNQNMRTRSKQSKSLTGKSSKSSSKSSSGKGKGKGKGSSPTHTYEPTMTPTTSLPTTTKQPVKQQPTPNPVPTKTPTKDFPTKLPTKPITEPPVIPSPTQTPSPTKIPSPTKTPSPTPPTLPTPDPTTPKPVKPITAPPTTAPTCVGPGC